MVSHLAATHKSSIKINKQTGKKEPGEDAKATEGKTKHARNGEKEGKNEIKLKTTR